MSLDLNKLSNKLDEALIKETTETLTKFLNDKRMTNNKQQISIEWFFNQLVANRIIVINGTTYWDKVKTKYEILLEQAKEMHQEEIDQSYRDGFEFALINECATQSTSEASKYAEGYKEGYKRALELVEWYIKNITNKNNEQR
jgi:tRNA(Met) C34 N-acetyltransferase TmcA